MRLFMIITDALRNIIEEHFQDYMQPANKGDLRIKHSKYQPLKGKKNGNAE